MSSTLGPAVTSLSWAALRGIAFVVCLAVMSCGGGGLGGSTSGGGGGTPPSGANVANVSVSAGPAGVNALNVLYATVTVCVPQTTTCQSIDNIQVDTGSYGLRLISQALNLTLPVAQAANGGALVECRTFVDGYSWGPVALVDVQIAGETAASVPVQLIGDARYPNVPNDCLSSGPTAENTVMQFGANGVLGIGPFAQDCGSFCASTIPATGIPYYSCASAAQCQGVIVALNKQVTNPVTLFATDNNGTLIELPTVAQAGATNVAGYLVFGVDTESNNMSGTETVVPIDVNTQYLTTQFQGQTLSSSFIDSGSNGDYFADSSITQCPASGGQSTNVNTFYCPATPVTVTAAFVLANNSIANESVLVASANTISNADTAYPGLAGTTSVSESFDWGLPFFYGRRVATVIEGASTSVGTGPYIAF